MASEDRNIGKLLRKYGYAFPQSEDEVDAFEKKFEKYYTKPNKWPSILDIINANDDTKKVIQLNTTENKSISNLAMAAREGKGISKKDREQMNKDKKDARKK